MFWWVQFINFYEVIALVAALATLSVSGSRIWKSLPRNKSAYAISIYQFQQSQDSWYGLTENAITFLKSLSSQDESRLRSGLGLMVHMSAPALFYDNAFSSKVSSTNLVLLFPVNGPFLGDGQFTTPNEVEWLIEMGLVREVPNAKSFISGQPIDLFHGDEVFRIQPATTSAVQVFAGTLLARELVLAAKDAAAWKWGCLQRLSTRIFPTAKVSVGKVVVRDRDGRRWVEAESLTQFLPQSFGP